MHLSHNGKLVRTDIWREGKYLDLWSVPHLLSGATLALAAHFVGFPLVPTYVIALLLLVAYEMFEALAKIEETRMNRVLDVVVGIASFVPTFLFATTLTAPQAFDAFFVVGSIDALVSWFGWHASHKAAALERTLRAEIQGQKEKMQERRTRLKEKLHEGRVLLEKERQIFTHRAP